MMGFADFLFRTLNLPKDPVTGKISLSAPIDKPDAIDIGAVAIAMAIHYVAATASQVRWQVVQGGKIDRRQEWHLLNFAPNANQSATDFWGAVISRMMVCGECLIVDIGGSLYICDSWSVDQHPTGEDIYSDITIGSDMVARPLPASDVLHLRLPAGPVPSASGIFATYADFVDLAKTGYVPDQRYVLSVDALAQGDRDFEKRYADITNNKIVPFLTAKKAVLPLFSGFSLSPLQNSGGSKSTSEATDADNMITAALRKAAAIYHIPAGLLLGDVTTTSDIVDNYLSTVVAPLLKSIAVELTRKRMTQAQIIAGGVIMPDMSGCRYVDPISKADKMDKLIASGYYTIDELKIRCGELPIGDDITSRRLVTKNYNTDIGGGQSEE